MNLEQTALSVVEQFDHARDMDLQIRERMLERFGTIAFAGFGLAIAAGILGIIYFIATRMILSGTAIWGGILLIFFMVFAGMALTYVFLTESLKDQRNKANARRRPSELEAPVTGRLLDEGNFKPAASVTEDTTELLGAENRTKRL